jgi:hypothetical protein
LTLASFAVVPALAQGAGTDPGQDTSGPGVGMRVLDLNGQAAEKVAANIGGWTAQ